MNAENQKLLLSCRKKNRPIPLFNHTLYYYSFSTAPQELFTNRVCRILCCTFSELQKIIFAKPNSNPDKGVVVHEEQELIIRKHFLHAFCFGKKI